MARGACSPPCTEETRSCRAYRRQTPTTSARTLERRIAGRGSPGSRDWLPAHRVLLTIRERLDLRLRFAGRAPAESAQPRRSAPDPQECRDGDECDSSRAHRHHSSTAFPFSPLEWRQFLLFPATASASVAPRNARSLPGFAGIRLRAAKRNREERSGGSTPSRKGRKAVRRLNGHAPLLARPSILPLPPKSMRFRVCVLQSSAAFCGAGLAKKCDGNCPRVAGLTCPATRIPPCSPIRPVPLDHAYAARSRVMRRSLECLLPTGASEPHVPRVRMIERYRSMHWIDDDEAETWERSIKAKFGDLAGERDVVSH